MQELEKWICIAKEDLLAAKALIKLELFSTVTYHCQQSAEKMLKAYLVFKEEQPPKSHDLMKLLELCMVFDRDFQKEFDAADYINPFSTTFRYPTEYEIPDLSEAEIAIKHAQSIMNFVIKKIEEPEPGQSKIFD